MLVVPETCGCVVSVPEDQQEPGGAALWEQREVEGRILPNVSTLMLESPSGFFRPLIQ